MDTVGAVTVPTIVAANHQATSVSTNAINVNQSNNSRPHPHILTAHSSSSGSNSNSNSNNNSNISNSIINSSLIISSNSSSSSSSSSSASSGYGSTSATPTNSYETHTAASTPIAIAEPIIPIATVAAVSPYFSESITTQALEGQHYAQQLQQQQQQHINPHQQHQPQSQLHHHQLQQNLQHTQRQQYYSTTYDYQQQQQQLLQQHQQQQQQQQPTHQQQQQQSHNLSLTYNMGSGSPATDSAPSATSSTTGLAYQGVGQYKPTDVGSINYERNLTGRPASSAAATGGATAGAAPSLHYQQPMQQQIPNASSSKHLTQSQHQQQQFLNATSSSKSRSASSLLGSSSSSSSSATTKPQAAATAFYAQPLTQQSNNSSSFYDNLKHKMPLDYHDNFVNFPNVAAYHQQQKYYAAAKSQLKEASSYGSPPGLTGKSLYPNANTYYPGPTGQHASSGYDKYMYPSAYPSLAYETPPDTAYRKGNSTGSINSHSWPWGIDYASGNSRTIPPPTSHIPTATVAPTHASYLTANTSHLARDPYYMAHDKYAMKYDKYPPPYQQTYVSPPATRHHLWPGTHAALSERLPPPPHTLHSTAYYPANAPTALNARQSCCTQPCQPQSCYYPPTRLPPHGQPSAMAQTSAYMGTAQPTAHPHQAHLSPLGSSCKYGSVIDYGAANKLKNPNDLYLSTRYDANPPPPPPHLTHNHGYNYGTTAAAANQLYNPNQIHHGAQPAGPLITHESLVNTPNFTNDLSLTSNTFDSYIHDPPHMNMNPQGLSIPSGPTTPGYAQAAAKRALLDYRKPIQPQPPPAPIQEECFEEAQNVLATSNISENPYQSADLLNTPETTTFIEYDTQTPTTGYTADERSETMEQTDKPSEETTKNVSLRDFIANWNDDEDEYAANEDIAFDQSTVINEVLKATTSAVPETDAVPQPVLKAEEVPPLLEEKVSAPENISKVSEVVSETMPSADIDSSQYVNLPDIIIDIEKSNVNTSTTTPSNTGDDDASILLDNFDVEKELDQLQLRKNESDSIIVKPHHDINPTKDSKPGISPKSKDSDPPKTVQINFDDFKLEQNKAVLPTRPTATDHLHSTPQSEQLLRDIEGYDSGNSRHSNESSLFEKEYETFINKITTIIPNTKSESDFEENVKEFSKFYKRKRKLRDEEVISPQCSGDDGKKLKSSDGEKVKNSNFPQVYTKKSRNRPVSVIQRLKQNQIRRRKPSSIYYKLIHSLRRYRRYRSKRVRDYIAELKEKHLPLIKRQSIKNYSIAANCQASPLFNPQSLKTLVLSVINSEVFRDRLMNLPMEVCLESEEKHICTDPACDTCDVIRSLMEPDAFERFIKERENIAKIDVSSENELIYMETQRDDLVSQSYDEALNHLESVRPQDSQLISEQAVKPITPILTAEVDTKLKTPCSVTYETKEITNTKTQVGPDEVTFSNLQTTTSVSNNLESQHVEDYMEIQDLSLPQNKSRLTSVVKTISQLEHSPIGVEKIANDLENFPENAQCRGSNVMFNPEIYPEIPSVIQTSSVVGTDVQNDDSNFKSSNERIQGDSKRDCPEVAETTSVDCQLMNDNEMADAQFVLSTTEINPEISSVIQKTSVILTKDQNNESDAKTSGPREVSKSEYTKISEMGSKIRIKTTQSESQDLEIQDSKKSKDENDITLKSPLNKIELDSDSDSESESSECDTDCSCSSCSSSESSEEDDKDDQDTKSRTSIDCDADEVIEKNSLPKKENLKRKTSKADAESCPKVIILNRIDSPEKCKADGEKSCLTGDLSDVETVTTLCKDPAARNVLSENRMSEMDNNSSNSFIEEPIASKPKDIVTESTDIKSPDRNSDEGMNSGNVNETIESDSSSDSSDSGESSDDDNDSSESEDEVKAKEKSQTENNSKETCADAETKKCKSIDSQDDDQPQDVKDLSKEEDLCTNKEWSNLSEQLQNNNPCRKESNSPHLQQDGTYSLSTNLKNVQTNSTPRELSAPKSVLNENLEKISTEYLTPEQDKAVVSTNNEDGNEENNPMVSNTFDIPDIEPLDYSTLRQDKVVENEVTREHEVINISEDSSSTKSSQNEASESEPVRPRIILSIKRTPEIVDTSKDATTKSVELNTESRGPYEKYYYTTKLKGSNFTNNFSEESQSSFGTEIDESEIEKEDDFTEMPKSDVTSGDVFEKIDSNGKYKFSPSAVATSTQISTKDNSLSSKDFNNLNLSEIDERMGDLFPQRPFGRASPIFDNPEESRLSTKSDSSANSEAKGLNRSPSLQSLQNPEDDNKHPGRDSQEPSVPSFEPRLLSNTEEEFFVEKCSMKQNFIQSATVIMGNPIDSKTLADSHRSSDDLIFNPTDVSLNLDEYYKHPWTSDVVEAHVHPTDHAGDQEFCNDGEQSVENNFKHPTLIKNLPEDATSSEVLESLRKANDSNKYDSVLTHKHEEHSENSVNSGFGNDFEKPPRFDEDFDANSKSCDSYLDNDNENFASEVQELKQLDGDLGMSQLIQDTHPEKYLPVLEDNEVNIQDNSLSSATSNEEFGNTKTSNMNRYDTDTPEGSMWNRVSVISFSHSNTEASDMQTNEEVISRRTTTDKSLDIFDESINSNLVNSMREETSDSNTCDDDSLKSHIKQKTKCDVEEDANDLGQFNFHSIFGNLEKLVGVKGKTENAPKQIYWPSAPQRGDQDARDNSGLRKTEDSKISFELTSISKEIHPEANNCVSQSSTSHNESLDKSICISHELEKQHPFQDLKCETSEQISGHNTVIVISDSPESPVNVPLLPQDETTITTRLYKSQSSVENNSESSLTVAKVYEIPKDRTINEIPSETFIHHQDKSLVNQIKQHTIECELLDPLEAAPPEDTNETLEKRFITEQDLPGSRPTKSDAPEEHQGETETLLAETSESHQTSSKIQSTTMNDKEDEPQEMVASETFDNHQCMSPLSPTNTNTSAKNENIKPVEESYAETIDATQTTPTTNLAKSDTLSSAEVNTLEVGLTSRECSDDHQAYISKSMEDRSLKEHTAEIIASQQSPFELSPVQRKTSENKQVDIQEEQLEKSIFTQQSPIDLRSMDAVTLRSEEDVYEHECIKHKPVVQHNLHKSNDYYEDFNKEVGTQEEFPEETFIPQQSPITLSSREADTLRSEENVHDDKCNGDKPEVHNNLHNPNDFNKEAKTHEEFPKETFIPDLSQVTLSSRELDTLRPEEDVPKDECTGDRQEVEDNLHKPNDYFEDITKEVKTQQGFSEETFIPEQSSTTLSSRELDTLRAEEDAPKDKGAGNRQEVEDNLHKPNENFEDFNQAVETQEKFSEEAIIPQQSQITLSSREPDTLRPEEDVPEDNCTGDRQKVEDNLKKSNNYFEDFNKEVETQTRFPEENFIPEQSPTTLSSREPDTLRSKEDVLEDNYTGDKQEVGDNFHKPREVETQKGFPEETFIPEHSPTTLSSREPDTLRSEERVPEVNRTGNSQNLEDNSPKPKEYCNKEVETKKEFREETFIPQQSPTTLSSREQDTLTPEEDAPEDNCASDEQEVAQNLHKSNEYFEEFNKKVESQDQVPENTFIPDQSPTALSTGEVNTLEPEKYVPVYNRTSDNQEVEKDEHCEDFSSHSASNEPIEEPPVYPRFGRFKNYRARNLENYKENKINENSENLDNTKSSSPKTEKQCHLQGVQHIEKDESSGYQGPVTDSPERCCEKPTEELPNVYSPKYEPVIVNAIECAEMSPNQSESSDLMGPTTSQPEIEESKSLEQLPSNTNIVASPIEPELATLSEDAAEEELECIYPVDTSISSMGDSLKCQSIPSQDSLKISTVLADELTNITNQDKTSTTDDMSTDFLGFKNQSSFEDESGDFHGFEDQHEEERIRREIENLNDDSTANDAFSYLCLDGKTSSHSGSMSSDLNELEALEKELSQHRLIRDLNDQDEMEEDAETDQHLVSVSNVSISTNDIEHIKQMLESDEEHADNVECKDNTHKDDRKSKLIALKENISLPNAFEIPKLSDLCRAALNSSLIVNNLTTVQSSEEVNPVENTTPLDAASSNALAIERELSVEEALAEMYRQAGVLLSDPEDTDNEKSISNEEAQDVLLINLQEILNSDNDNVYVLQCDMNVNVQDTNNENHLHDDNRNGHESETGNGIGNANDTTERVNTLQLIGILNTNLENPEIHIISSDSESEVIILSDCDTDVEFHSEPFSPPPQPPPTLASTSAFISTRDFIPFIDDLETNDDSQSDLSTIHHEEIVPDNLNKFLKEEFYRYLHEKYAQKKLSKYYHANRVLRKYKKRYSNRFRQ